MDIVTTAAQSYLHVFHGYVSQCLAWGKGLFLSLLTINLVWMALGYAFDRHDITETVPAFIKRFFVITFFYTLMLHPAWLGSLAQTAHAMGQSLVHAPIDPSSIIAMGIGMGNQLLIPVSESSLFTMGFGMIIIAVVYLMVLFVFISIALDLALTLIVTTALISVATFFLGFAALDATSAIARQTLDAIVGQCVKLLGIYLVVAAGSQTLLAVTAAVPHDIKNLDPYGWIMAVVWLFWLLTKQLPQQLARLVSGAVAETHAGNHALALATSASQLARLTTRVAQVTTGAIKGTAILAGSTAYNAAQHAKQAFGRSGNPATAVVAGVAGSARQVSQSLAETAWDHAQNLGDQAVGGPGTGKTMGVSRRLYHASKSLQRQSDSL